MDDDEKEETTTVTNFFSKRAKFVPKISAEDLKAASELINEFRKEKISSKKQKSYVPHAPDSKTNPKGKKTFTDIDELLVEKTVIESPLVSEIELSSSAKRRLKKFKQERRQELLSIEADNERILSVVNNTNVTKNTNSEVAVDDDFDELTVLTISFMSEISRFKCYKTEKFSSIFPRVAELFKLKVSEFLLCHGENNIAVDDTPGSLNLSSCDILDCIPYKADEDMQADDKYDDNKLKIFFQTSYDKEKISIVVHKLEKMQNVMEQYSKLQDLPLNEFAFEFDGDRIMGTETAEDLDMDPGNCIDVVVFNLSRKLASSKKRVIVSTDNCATTLSVNSNATTSSVNSPTTSAVNSPTTSAVNSPTTSAVNSPTISSVNSPTTSPINTATTSSKKPGTGSRTPTSSKKRVTRSRTPVTVTKLATRSRTPALAKKRATRSRTPASAKKRATRSSTPASAKKRATRSSTSASAKKRTTRSSTPASAKKCAPAKSKKQARVSRKK